MTGRPRLVVHGHFYQPSRIDPWTGSIPRESAAAPFHDWNERIDAESYRPNSERGNFGRISFDMGPTLASWLAAEDPATYQRVIAADSGNAMAQGYHHSILPLASHADRRTEIRWGLRDFELRFGRRAEGFWLPETAVDLPSLRLLAQEGVRYTILAPWQTPTRDIETRQPYRVDLGNGSSIVVVFYDGGLSAAVSFEPAATADADRFATERIVPRLTAAPVGVLGSFASPGVSGGVLAGTPTPPLAVIATDGELYGHHQVFRDLFLQRLVAPDAEHAEVRPFDIVDLATALREDEAVAPFPWVLIDERTSWSCHHGIARWSAECPDAADGRWKDPLRSAFVRLSASIDLVSIDVLRGLDGGPLSPEDFAEARNSFVDVLFGVESPDDFARRCLPDASERDAATYLRLLEAQRWRLAMFASDGWYWDDPARIETAQVLRAAARAVRIVDEVAETRLEERLLDDLTLLNSPSRGVDGAVLFREALAAVGQPSTH